MIVPLLSHRHKLLCRLVGASRFERPTTRTPSEYATGLRHAPTSLFHPAMAHIVALNGAGLQLDGYERALNRRIMNGTQESSRSLGDDLVIVAPTPWA